MARGWLAHCAYVVAYFQTYLALPNLLYLLDYTYSNAVVPSVRPRNTDARDSRLEALG